MSRKARLFSVVSLLMLACHASAVTVRQKVGTFDAIDSQGPFTIALVHTKQSTASVVLSGPKKELQFVSVKVKNHTLVLKAVHKENFILPEHVSAKIYMPYLKNLWLSNTTKLHATKFNGQHLTIHVAGRASVTMKGVIGLDKVVQEGNGTLAFQWVRSPHLIVRASGSGTIHLAGAVDQLDARLSGASVLKAKFLRSQKVFVQTKQASVAEVQPVFSLRAFAYDQSNIYYYNKPKHLTRHTRDSGNVLYLTGYAFTRIMPNNHLLRSHTQGAINHLFEGTYFSISPELNYNSYSEFRNVTPNASASSLPSVNDSSAHGVNLGASIAAGYDWYNNFRWPVRSELRATYYGSIDYDPNPVFSNGSAPQASMSSDVETYSLMLNTYIDIYHAHHFAPFIGAGFGWAWNKVDGTSTLASNSRKDSVSGSRADFAWNLQAGVRYRLTRCIRLALIYRYAQLGRAQWKGIGGSSSITARNVSSHGAVFNLTFYLH